MQARVSSDSADLDAQVRTIISEVTGMSGEEIKHDSPIYRIGSSNDAIEVVMQCEEAFGIEIPDEDAERYETVAGLVAYIMAKLGHENHETHPPHRHFGGW